KKIPRPRPADLASWLNDLATILKHEDKLADAETLYREALAINKRFLGNEHREVAVTLNNLAQVVGWQGKLGEEEQLMREALQMGRNLWGNEHPLVAKVRRSRTMLPLFARK